MKKLAVFLFVFLGLILGSCKNSENQVLLQTLEESTAITKFQVSVLEREFEFAAAENHFKAKVWNERSKQIGVIVQDYLTGLSISDNQEDMIRKFEICISELDSVFQIENYPIHTLQDAKRLSLNELRIYLEAKMVMYQYAILDGMRVNINVSICYFYGVRGIYFEDEMGTQTVHVVGDTEGLLPKRVVQIDRITYNGKDTLVDFEKYTNVLGSVYFNNLSKGNYSLKGKVVYERNKTEIDEVPFESEFEVK